MPALRAGLLAAHLHPKHSTAPPLEERWNVCGFKLDFQGAVEGFFLVFSGDTGSR